MNNNLLEDFINYVKSFEIKCFEGECLLLNHKTLKDWAKYPFSIGIYYQEIDNPLLPGPYYLDFECDNESHEEAIRKVSPELLYYPEDIDSYIESFRTETELFEILSKFSPDEWEFDKSPISLSELQEQIKNSKNKDLKQLLLECSDICNESLGDSIFLDAACVWNKPFRKYLKKNYPKKYAKMKEKCSFIKSLGIFELLDLSESVFKTKDVREHPQDTKALNIFLNFCRENQDLYNMLVNKLPDIIQELREEDERDL